LEHCSEESDDAKQESNRSQTFRPPRMEIHEPEEKQGRKDQKTLKAIEAKKFILLFSAN
jgi:hypothetical protein